MSKHDNTPLSELLEEVHSALGRYVVFPTPQAQVAATLWAAATHAVDGFQHAPRLCINSPEKRCGKSRLLDVVAALSCNPLIAVNASVNSIFRLMGTDPVPTLFLDEADTIFGTKRAAENNEDLRGLLNAGHQRGRPAYRCVGPNSVPMAFQTFGFAALAGIGDLPDTITDRAVNITLRRRGTTETVSPYRERRDGPKLKHLQDRLTAWATNAIPTIRNMEPDMPVEDRAADTWEPLICVADLAGCDWPQRGREACLFLTAQADEADEETSQNVRLLRDIHEAFNTQCVSFIGTKELLENLHALPEGSWAHDLRSGRALGQRLKHFGVVSQRDPSGTRRGYRQADFRDAFSRYLSHTSEPSEVTRTPELQRIQPDTSPQSDTSKRQIRNKRQAENTGNTSQTTHLTVLTDETTGRSGTAC